MGYAGRQACRRSAIMKYFFAFPFPIQWGQKGMSSVNPRRRMTLGLVPEGPKNRKCMQFEFPLFCGFGASVDPFSRRGIGFFGDYERRKLAFPVLGLILGASPVPR